MPIYEYRCADCGEKSSFFARSVFAEVEAVCERCGGKDMHRLISAVSFRSARGGAASEGYYSDSSNIGRRVEESYKKFGVDMPDSVRKTIDDARKGKMPGGLDL